MGLIFENDKPVIRGITAQNNGIYRSIPNSTDAFARKYFARKFYFFILEIIEYETNRTV